MESVIPAILGLLQQFLPMITGSSPAISKAVTAVVALTPIVVQEYKDLRPIVSNIIKALKADPATVPAQIEQLEAAEAILDADFDDAADKATAEDDAANAAAKK